MRKTKGLNYIRQRWLIWLALLLLTGCLTGSPGVSTPVPTSPATETAAPADTSVATTTFVPPVTATDPAFTATSPATRPAINPATETVTTAPPLPTDTPTAQDVIRFAVIGDYGSGDPPEGEVAALVKSWTPDFVITTGDNNYPIGSGTTIDRHIGQFYSDFIYPYQGEYGPGAQDTNRFFPTLGNHDWTIPGAAPYLNYFTLPGNERYYDFTWGPVHFFALDSDSREPDGVGRSSVQGQWLQGLLSESSLPWQIVFFHHAPYASGPHGATDWMQWPFAEWGAEVVIAGHEHIYERLERDGIPYFVNGLGGGAIYNIEEIAEGSVVQYNLEYGAMLVVASPESVQFEFVTVTGEVIDQLEIRK